MQYKIHPGPLAAAYLHAYGIQQWRRIADDSLAHNGLATLASLDCEGYEITLAYRWMPLEHHAELYLSLIGDGWTIQDQIHTAPNLSVSIKLMLKDAPESVLHALQHQPFAAIVDAPAWARGPLEEYRADGRAQQGATTSLLGTPVAVRHFIAGRQSHDEDPLTPDFEGMTGLRSVAG